MSGDQQTQSPQKHVAKMSPIKGLTLNKHNLPIIQKHADTIADRHDVTARVSKRGEVTFHGDFKRAAAAGIEYDSSLTEITVLLMAES